MALVVLAPTLASYALYDANIRLSRSLTQPVTGARNGPVSLDRYMQLPVDQYCAIPLPMQASLTRTPRTDEFEMRVPPLAFTLPGQPITVAPLVLATVVRERDRVVIRSRSCTLTGSPRVMRLIEATRLNDHFDFSVRQHGRFRRPGSWPPMARGALKLPPRGHPDCRHLVPQGSSGASPRCRPKRRFRCL